MRKRYLEKAKVLIALIGDLEKAGSKYSNGLATYCSYDSLYAYNGVIQSLKDDVKGFKSHIDESNRIIEIERKKTINSELKEAIPAQRQR